MEVGPSRRLSPQAEAFPLPGMFWQRCLAWGKSFIQGGRKPLRDALYLPAIVATRYNPDLKAQYERMKAAGKPSKVALTAIMRKLLILANTLVKEDRE